MIELDDGDLLAANDPQKFLRSVEQLGDQLAEGWELGRSLTGIPRTFAPDGLAVLGVGGSAISGDVLKAVLGPGFRHVVEVCRGYEVPGWVGRNTLVFAVSYSGRTEETLEAFDRALVAGARPVVIATGGLLAERGTEERVPVARLRPGLQPRAALGLMLMTMLGVCSRLDLGRFDGAVAEATELIRRRAGEYGPDRPTEVNRAKQLAVHTVGMLPMVYGSEGLAQVAAYRWKCQFNECAKVHAYCNYFSEVNHNEVMGFSPAGLVLPMKHALIVLRHAGEHPRIERRIEATLPLIDDRPSVVEEVWAAGESALARILDLIYLGDFVATYTALAQGIDPTCIDLIDEVKRRLTASGPATASG